jgi:putative NIF3 family GTP cyclohydrolase 1 type 2
MQLKLIRFTKLSNQKINKIAVCGGAGSFLTKKAISSGVQAFVSADFKYHEFFDAENRILIADIGHFESEKYTKDLLSDLIVKKFPNFAVLLSFTHTNPVNYYI